MSKHKKTVPYENKAAGLGPYFSIEEAATCILAFKLQRDELKKKIDGYILDRKIAIDYVYMIRGKAQEMLDRMSYSKLSRENKRNYQYILGLIKYIDEFNFNNNSDY